MRLPDGARWRASVPPPAPLPMMITSYVWAMSLILRWGARVAEARSRRRSMAGPLSDASHLRLRTSAGAAAGTPGRQGAGCEKALRGA